MNTAQVDISIFSQILDLSGVFLAALLGGILARADKLDPVGFIVVAIASGLGGGLIRDTLIQKGTPVTLTDSIYIVLAIIGAVLAYLLPIRGKLWDRVYPWLDALLLGVWTAAGADRALAYGMDWMPATLLGLITGIGGGVIRDVLLQRVPGVFRSGTLYASSALLASGTLVLLNRIGLHNIALAASVIVGTGLTLLARERGWQLPNSEEAEEMLPDHIPTKQETKRWWRRNSVKFTGVGKGNVSAGRPDAEQPTRTPNSAAEEL